MNIPFTIDCFELILLLNESIQYTVRDHVEGEILESSSFHCAHKWLCEIVVIRAHFEHLIGKDQAIAAIGNFRDLFAHLSDLILLITERLCPSDSFWLQCYKLI